MQDRERAIECLNECDYDIDLKKGKTSHKILHSVATYLLFFFNIDPFAVYKDVEGNQLPRYRIHQMPQFGLKKNTTDTWREKWRKIFVIWTSYIVLKCVIILVNQLILYNVDPGTLGIQINAFEELCKDPSWVKFALYSNHMVGNPLSTTLGLSISFSGYLALTLTHNFIWHIHYFVVNLLDSNYLRIFLKPELEMKRIDYLIEERLVDLRVMMLGYERIEQGRFYVLESSRVGECIEVDLILKNLQKRIKSMRPIFYTKRPMYHLYEAAVKVSILMTCLALPWPFLLANSLLNSILRSRCGIEHIGLEKCSSGDILTWRDFITFTELVIAITLQGTLMTLEILIILSNIYCQLQTAKYIESELTYLLNWLRIDNRMQLDGSNSNSSSNSNGLSYLNEMGDEIYDSFGIEQMLLKMLIKIRLIEDDVIRNNGFISQASTTFLSIISSGLVLILISGKLQEAELNNLRFQFFLWLLIVGNITALGCAFAYAKLVKLEKTLFAPLMAQILIKDQLPRQRYWFRIIAICWHKLIRSSRFSDPTSSVRFFNVTLTYEKIISMNFVLISLGAILKSL